MTSERIKDATRRFWSRVNYDGPYPSEAALKVYPEIAETRCWLWTGGVDRDGYGFIRVHLRPARVSRTNRFAFFLKYGFWPKECALHKCDNVACVRGSHIFEGSVDLNNKDRAKKGRSFKLKPGECHCTAKLTIAQVVAIRKIKSGTQRDIGDAFGISQAQVSRIRNGALWRHVEAT